MKKSFAYIDNFVRTIKISSYYMIFCCGTLFAIVPDDFFRSIKNISKDCIVKFEDSCNKAFIKHLLELYEKNNPATIPFSESLKIPLIIHQIWVGGKPLPPFYAKLAETWKTFHPQWKYVLWDDEAVTKIDMINATSYRRATSLSEKANILRLELLYKYGGL